MWFDILVGIVSFGVLAAFLYSMYSRYTNRGTIGLHRHPENIRRKFNEEVESTGSWHI